MSSPCVRLSSPEDELAWRLLCVAVKMLAESDPLYLMFADQDGNVGHLLAPSCEREVVQKLLHYDWSRLKVLVEEFA